MREKKWRFCKIDGEYVAQMAARHDITRLQAALLYNRGITEPDDVTEFFCNDIESEIEEPFALADMEAAVDRIRRAVETKEKICIFGDYDSDGVTSTVMLYKYLTSQGADVCWCLPSRDEGGYGMNTDIISKLADDGVKLLVTVDNGVAAYDEIEFAKGLGLDVVVTDHHIVPQKLPDCIVVDPNRLDCPSRFKGLCGAGVAFKLICAMEEDMDSVLEQYGDILTVGTIADIVPIVGENRVLVRHGLPMLENTKNIGLRVMMNKTGMKSRFGVQSVAFVLAPRINAAGRMGDAGDAVRLLLSQTEEEAAVYANKLDKYNQLRQQTEQRIYAEAARMYGEIPQLRHSPVGIVWKEDWESGVAGIVAAKLVENFGKPFIVFGIKDGVAVGSARSVEGFSMYDAVCACSEHLTRYGGHSQAVGITMPEENLESFANDMLKYTEKFGQISPNSFLIDGNLKIEQLQMTTLEQVEELEPFGRDNPSPLFCLSGVTIKDIRPMKTGGHCMVDVTKNGNDGTLLLFGTNLRNEMYRVGDKVDAIISLSSREYNNTTELSVIIKDIRYYGFDEDNYFNCKFEFDQTVLYRRKPSETVRREDVATVYRALREFGFVSTLSVFAHRLYPYMPYLRVLLCMEILRQLGLVSLEADRIVYIDTKEKTDLTKSWLYTLASDPVRHGETASAERG